MMPRPAPDLFALRNPGIDIVRGVSIMLVVIHHTALRIPLAKTALASLLPGPLLMALSWDGYEAVFAFFVVSGFLITGNAIRRWGSLRRLRLGTFYGGRLARIAPCLLALLAVLSLLDLARVPDYAIARPDQSLPGAVLAALGSYLNRYEGHTGYLPGNWDVLWSLSIEEIFYAGFPLICAGFGRIRFLLPCLLGVLALSLPWDLQRLSGATEIWREKATLPGMAAIAMGALAALAVAAVPAPPRRAVAAGLGWSGVAVLAAIFWNETLCYRLLGTGTMLALTGGVASLMIAFSWGWGERRAVRPTAWLRSFGLISYEIYLTHMFVVFTLVGLFRRTGGDLQWGWIWFAPVLALSWGLGRLVERWLSRPADRWLRDRMHIRAASSSRPARVV